LKAAEESEEDIDAKDPSNSSLAVFFQLMGTEIALEDPDWELLAYTNID
jgi:hypothetical protein